LGARLARGFRAHGVDFGPRGDVVVGRGGFELYHPLLV
jgi:hypothetical protein